MSGTLRIALAATILALAAVGASPALGASRPVDAPPGATGGCSALGDIALYPDGLRPASTIPANGQLVDARSNMGLYTVFGNTFGGGADHGY